MTNDNFTGCTIAEALARLCAAHPATTPAGTVVTVAGAWGATFEVTAGRLDDVAEAAFGRGQCHALAFALAEATGFELVWVGIPECSYDPDCGDWWARYDGVRDWCECQIGHVAVRTPTGHVIDIGGVDRHRDDPDDPATHVAPLDVDHLEWIASSPTWRAPDIALARSFVAAVLERAGHTGR